MAKVLDYDLEVSEFEHQLRYYFHFRTNTLGESIESSYPRPAMGWILSLLFYYRDGFGIK